MSFGKMTSATMSKIMKSIPITAKTINSLSSSSSSLSSSLLKKNFSTAMVGNFGDRPTPSKFLQFGWFLQRNWKPLLGGTVVGSVVGQHYYGYTADFYDYRFVTNADPADLQDFYGSENFMDIYCVMPFMGTLMMRGGYFDDDGVCHTTGLPGEMQVSMVFSDSDEEIDDDDEIAGEITKNKSPLSIAAGSDPDGVTSYDGQWFNKRERFKDVWLGMTMWDMVTNFGFETLPDGRTMVYHHGEYFKGNIPPVSLVVRLIFSIHARWVAWATEHHINHYAFKNDTEFDEKLEHDSRIDMPLFLLKNYAWSDLMGAVFGRKLHEPSFLIKRSKEEADKLRLEEGSEDDDEEEESVQDQAATTLAHDQIEKQVLSKRYTLPVQKPSVQRHITLDIQMDRRNSRIALNVDDDDNFEDIAEGDDTELFNEQTQSLMRRITKEEEKDEKHSPQRFTTAVALNRYKTMNRRLTSMVQVKPPTNDNEETDNDGRDDKAPVREKLQHRLTLKRENLGGSVAWEALRSTNNPESYKAATVAAKDRFLQRRATSTLMKKHDVRTLPKYKRSNTGASD